MSAYDVRGVPDAIAVPAGNGHLIVKNPGDQGLGAFGEQTSGAFIGTVRVGGATSHVIFVHHLPQAAQELISGWNVATKVAAAITNAFYIKVEVGIGLKAQVKAGPMKFQVGLKSVRESNAAIISIDITSVKAARIFRFSA